jgi:hypothetical protein
MGVGAPEHKYYAVSIGNNVLDNGIGKRLPPFSLVAACKAFFYDQAGEIWK